MEIQITNVVVINLSQSIFGQGFQFLITLISLHLIVFLSLLLIKDGDRLQELISLPNSHLTVWALFSNYIKADKGSEGTGSSRLNYRHTATVKVQATFTTRRRRQKGRNIPAQEKSNLTATYWGEKGG